MGTDIKRIDHYEDDRFSKKVLYQHGAFLVNGRPYEVEVTGSQSAVIRGEDAGLYPEIIDTFRFYAGHIRRFTDKDGKLVQEFPPVEIFRVGLEQIQPSQFYVDEAKLAAVKSFINAPEDIVIPVLRDGKGYISLDGHTRLTAAIDLGHKEVCAFIDEDPGCIHGFVDEARKRGIHTPYDMKRVTHDEYDVLWNKFCDDYFAREVDGMIRYAAENDFEALARLDRHISPDELRNAINLQRVLILEDGDGLAGWLRYNLFWDNTPFINLLYVLDGKRGQGLGWKLVEHWENEMRSLGYGEVLTSTLSNERAQFFYRKHGYTDCGSLLLPGEPLEIILRKSL